MTARRTPPRRPVRDEDLDPEGPGAADLERFGHDWVSCPNCSADVSDQAEVCPVCGAFVRRAGPARLPRWVIIAAVAALVGFVLVVIR